MLVNGEVIKWENSSYFLQAILHSKLSGNHNIEKIHQKASAKPAACASASKDTVNANAEDSVCNQHN